MRTAIVDEIVRDFRFRPNILQSVIFFKLNLRLFQFYSSVKFYLIGLL